MPGFPDNASSFEKVADFYQTSILTHPGIVNGAYEAVLRRLLPQV